MDSIRQNRNNLREGFTLIEILLSLALVTLLTAISVPFYQSFQQANELDATKETILSALRTAKTYARESKDNANWGVYISTENVVLFQGDSYTTRDPSYDLYYSISSKVSLYGSTEFVFNTPFGSPTSTGTIGLAINNKSDSILVNEKSVLP